MQPEELDGRRVLLILIPRDAPRTAHFVAGPARWTGSALHVRYDPAQPEAVARASREALAAFDPTLLPRLIVPEHYPRVAAIAQRVEAAVAVFKRDRPAGALTLEDAFFGLAVRGEDDVLLMQGGLEDDWTDEEGDVEPWEDRPWRPDSQAT